MALIERVTVMLSDKSIVELSDSYIYLNGNSLCECGDELRSCCCNCFNRFCYMRCNYGHSDAVGPYLGVTFNENRRCKYNAKEC